VGTHFLRKIEDCAKALREERHSKAQTGSNVEEARRRAPPERKSCTTVNEKVGRYAVERKRGGDKTGGGREKRKGDRRSL